MKQIASSTISLLHHHRIVLLVIATALAEFFTEAARRSLS